MVRLGDFLACSSHLFIRAKDWKKKKEIIKIKKAWIWGLKGVLGNPFQGSAAIPAQSRVGRAAKTVPDTLNLMFEIVFLQNNLFFKRGSD